MPVVPMHSHPRGNSLRPRRPPVSPTFLAMAAAQMSQEARQPIPSPEPTSDSGPSAALASTQSPAPNA